MSADPRRQALDDERRALRRGFMGDDGRPHQDGALMLRWMARKGHVFQRMDTRRGDGSIDPVSMAHLEGGRRLVLELLVELGLNPLGLAAEPTSEGDDHG